jgi:benzoyl-CoA reductase/2-hydroxyglutaryl-CoA dehydratase subunit BcrC/BadD/HgdB
VIFMPGFIPPPRKEYLKTQKEVHGRHLLGVFPAQYPREILWAFNILPVEIWDPPLEVSNAGAHLQPYICSVVKLGLELILQGKCADLDGFLFPHTCDSIQNLTSIVTDYLGLEKPCYFFYHPKQPYKDSARSYYRDHLKYLVSRLENQWGPLDRTELRKRIKQGQEVASLLGKIYDQRARGQLDSTNWEFYRVIRQGEFLHPDDYIPLLQQYLDSAAGEADGGLSVVLTGVLPNPPEILTLLDETGIRVSEDDFLNCSRRFTMPPSSAEDPFEAMTESYFGMPPCTTKNSPLSVRLDALLDKIERGGAKGVIFYMVKFCEPELFDVPEMVEGLREKGILTLVMDVEINQGFGGQLATRVEAFAEMLRA